MALTLVFRGNWKVWRIRSIPHWGAWFIGRWSRTNLQKGQHELSTDPHCKNTFGTRTSNFSTGKSQAACDGWSWRLVLTRLHLRDTSPGSLSSHGQRGKRRTALGCCLASAFPRRCLPRQQDSCQILQDRWHQVLSECSGWSPDVRGCVSSACCGPLSHHSSSTWL